MNKPTATVKENWHKGSQDRFLKKICVFGNVKTPIAKPSRNVRGRHATVLGHPKEECVQVKRKEGSLCTSAIPTWMTHEARARKGALT